MDNTKQVVFKITLQNGTRISLAAERADAIEWSAFFNGYANSSRLMSEWRDMWGTQRSSHITLRDYINVAAVIVKLGRGKHFEEEAEKQMAAANVKAAAAPPDKAKSIRAAAKREVKRAREELVVTDRDKFHLSVLGLTTENAEQASGAVLAAIKSWIMTKVYIRQLDRSVTGGYVVPAVSGFVGGVIGSIRVSD